MNSLKELKNKLYGMNHKPYGMYKQLAGEYEFPDYILCIDHVQGDPFAAPSRVRICVTKEKHGFFKELYDTYEKRIMLEDHILRQFAFSLKKNEDKCMGSGKSGRLSTCRTGQEVLERTALVLSKNQLEARFEVGFPARGRSILAEELETILFEILPKAAESLFYKNLNKKVMEQRMELAVNQTYVRGELKRRNLVAFVANDSILPRESGVSARPMKDAVPFTSPKTLEVELTLPYGGCMRGMGIKEGITVIVGGGYHGKSTLLKALEAGVYNHIPGDGREYVITRTDAMKLRSEDGRSVTQCNISPFINHLPNGQDTTCFSTENASGSTSQAANVVEAIEAGSRTFLIDEDTTATNFMARDTLMSQLVSDEEEPISPFLLKVNSLYTDNGISTVIVVGSNGDYLAVADTVLQLNQYQVEDVTEKAKQLCTHVNLKKEKFPDLSFTRPFVGKIPTDKYGDYKIKTAGTDTVMVNYETIDVRYLEQLVDGGQSIVLGMMMRELLTQGMEGKKTKQQLVEALYERIQTQGLSAICQKGYPSGHPVMVRKQEMYAFLNRWRRENKK